MKLWPFHRAPDVEQKSLANPDPELIEIFAGSAGGTAMGRDPLQVPAVAAAVRAISEACATLDLFVERKDGENWTADPAHPAAKLLHGDVNEWTSGFEFIRDLVAQALTHDAGGLAWIGRAEGRPVEIIHYRPGSITVAYEDTGEPRYSRNGAIIPAADIIHLRGPFSRCPVSLAREAIDTARDMERHASNLFRKGARPAGVIQFPAGANVGANMITRMKAAWRAAYEGAENSGSTAVLYAGGTFNPLTFSSVDAQFLELRRFQVEEICRAFRVPPGLLYEMTRQTWSNMEQATREFLVFSLEAWLRALEAALQRALIAPNERRSVRIRIDRDDLTRSSLVERATAINSLRASEVLSADEGRDWLDLPPRADGKGGSYGNPNITVKPAAPASEAA